MTFLQELQKTGNKTARTANGAVTNNSTLNPVLDFFSLAGAMRNSPNEALKLFRKAFVTDTLAAVRTLFYFRDIRGGQGERELFRGLMKDLAPNEPAIYAKVLQYVPEYGRWDDLWAGDITTPIMEMIIAQINADEAAMAKGESISQMAKWLPSEAASSRKTRTKANVIILGLGWPPSVYRKRVAALRKYIQLLEQKMSSNLWAEIDYSKLPSQAGRKHTKAFMRHDQERYTEYLGKAVKGEAKMNTKTLFTYEVFDEISKGNAEAANAMWANLPDYTNDSNALVIADVSGSMSGRPMSVSVSLALYFAERNKGVFKDYFMTFTEQPKLVKVVGRDLTEKLSFIENQEWHMSTNIEAAFAAILKAAKAAGDNGDSMPKVLYIISDMQFNEAVQRPGDTNFENAQKMFEAEGLELPHVVFWNVNASDTQAPATMFDSKVTLISGLSASTFRYTVEGKTPLELMDEVINSERYARITI